MTNENEIMRPNKKIVVLDFETTGFNVLNGDRVTEVGAITIDGRTGEEMGSFDALVYTDKQIPKKVQELTGITNEMLDKYGMNEELVKSVLQHLCEDAIVVAHNASFDFSYLKWQFNIEPKLFYDTLTIDRALHPKEKKHNLGTICEREGIELTNAHRAIFDTRATVELLNKQLDKPMVGKEFMNVISGKMLKFKPANTVKVIQ